MGLCRGSESLLSGSVQNITGTTTRHDRNGRMSDHRQLTSGSRQSGPIHPTVSTIRLTSAENPDSTALESYSSVFQTSEGHSGEHHMHGVRTKKFILSKYSISASEPDPLHQLDEQHPTGHPQIKKSQNLNGIVCNHS